MEPWALTYFGLASLILGAVVVAQWIVLFILIQKILVHVAICPTGPRWSTALVVTAVVVGCQVFGRFALLLLPTAWAAYKWILEPMFRGSPRGFGRMLVFWDIGDIVAFAVLATVGAIAIRLVNRWAREAD